MCLNVFENQGECTLKVLAVNSKGPLKCSGFIISKAFIEMPAEIDIDEADVLVLSQELQKTSKLTFEINKSLKKLQLHPINPVNSSLLFLLEIMF